MKKLKIDHTLKTIQNIKELSDLTNDFSAKIGLRNAPNILFSQIDNLMPVVYGRNQKDVTLVLPKNFNEMINRIAGGEKKSVTAVQRFIIYHELSHIKNGDYKFMSWSASLLSPLKYWLILYLLATPFLIISVNLKSTILLTCMAFCLLITFYLISKSVARYREYLADARAWLYIPKEEKDITINGSPLIEWVLIHMEILTGSRSIDKKKYSLKDGLDLIVYLLIKEPFKNIFVKARNYMFADHPEYSKRCKVLKEELFISERKIVPSYEATFWIIATVIFIYLINGVSLVLFSFSKEKGGIVLDLLLLIACQYISLNFIIPFYNSAIESKINKNYIYQQIKMLTWGFLIIFVLAFPLIISDYSIFVMLFVSFFFTMYCILGFSVAISHSLPRIELSENEVKSDFKIALYGVICSLIILSVLVINSYKIIGFFNLLLGLTGGAIITLRILARGPSTSIFLDNSIIIRGYKKLYVFETRFTLWYYLSFLIGLLATLIISALILAYLFYIINVENAFDITSNYVKGNVFFEIIFYGLILSLILLCVFVVFRKKENKDFLFIGRDIYKKIVLFDLFSYRLNPVYLPKKYFKRFKVPQGGYTQHEKFNISNMEKTYYAAYALNSAGQLETDSNTLLWCLSCENKNGGFGLFNAVHTRLVSTYYALKILEIYNSVNSIDKSKHINWIKQWQKEDGSFHGPLSRRTDLEDTYFALGVLVLLGGIREINIESCKKWVLKNWRTGQKGYQTTHYTVQSLEWLGSLNDETAEEIENSWLLPYKPVILSLRVDKSIPLIYHYINTAYVLFKKDMKRVKELLGELPDNVTKHSEEYFSKLPIT